MIPIITIPAGKICSIVMACGALLFFLQSCNSSSANTEPAPATLSLPVISVTRLPATTHQEFPATIEGKVNVEIRPQVDGYLEKIFVDEGAYVRAGQPLFKINDRVYREQLSNAQAGLQASQANLQRAQVELDKLAPLVENNVVSDVQLKTAQASYDAAKAAVSQTKAMVGNARINTGYTLLRAPVSGYIGRIPYRTGSLVGRGESRPLTLLSDVSEVYAYFSMSELDFLRFKNRFPGNSIEEKIKAVPPVELIIADNSAYPHKGKITAIEGQFDKSMGSISFRATLKNAQGTLRSGSTGKIRIPEFFNDALVVPKDATFEIQDKIFVFALSDSNKVSSKPIRIAGKTANYYFVDSGLRAGDKIVFSGMGNLRDGMTIDPGLLSVDSLLKTRPL